MRIAKRLARTAAGALLVGGMLANGVGAARAEPDLLEEPLSETAPTLLGSMGCDEITISRSSRWNDYRCKLSKLPSYNGHVSVSVQRLVNIPYVSLSYFDGRDQSTSQVAELALRRLLTFLQVADPEPIVRAYFSWMPPDNHRHVLVMHTPRYDVLLKLDLGGEEFSNRNISICKSGCWANYKVIE